MLDVDMNTLTELASILAGQRGESQQAIMDLRALTDQRLLQHPSQFLVVQLGRAELLVRQSCPLSDCQVRRSQQRSA